MPPLHGERLTSRQIISYLNVNHAVCSVPSANFTVIDLQVPAQDFDVCQLKMYCVPSHRNTVEPGLSNTCSMGSTAAALSGQATWIDVSPFTVASVLSSQMMVLLLSVNCHLIGTVCPAFKEFQIGVLSTGCRKPMNLYCTDCVKLDDVLPLKLLSAP